MTGSAGAGAEAAAGCSGNSLGWDGAELSGEVFGDEKSGDVGMPVFSPSFISLILA
jgi:hypothetical protein